MKNVVSFSGGRTSAYLVHLMEQRRKLEGLDVRYLFMDTGAEHPKTYDFIRKIVSHFDIDLVCLRVAINPELGQPNSYQVVSLDECCHDLKPWRDMLKKYGTPYLGGAFCTDRMKLGPFKKYCDEHYGKGGYTTWLGIRADEQSRLKATEGVSYLADISDAEKEDILQWWEDQPFDLEINEHLGNCVFCIKKSSGKLQLATHDAPELAQQFKDCLTAPTVRQVESREGDQLVMYRGKTTFKQIIATAKLHSRDEIANTLRSSKRYDTGSCSESCEVFSCQLDLDL